MRGTENSTRFPLACASATALSVRASEATHMPLTVVPYSSAVSSGMGTAAMN